VEIGEGLAQNDLEAVEQNENMINNLMSGTGNMLVMQRAVTTAPNIAIKKSKAKV